MTSADKLFKLDKWKYFDLIGYKPHPRQRLFHESNARFKVPICGRRMGKALDIETLVPTQYGMIKMRDLQVGDQVFDENGKLCNVTFVSEIWKEDSFKLLFDDGSTLVAHGGHEWLTYDKKARKTRESANAKHESDRRRKLVPPVVRTTNEIANTLMYGTEPNHAIQLTGPVEFPKQELPIDPYLLGVWLGDGSTSDGTICIANQDEWIMNKLVDRGHEMYTTKSEQGCKVWRVLGFRVALKENFLLGNKHVPPAYLYGSVEQRQDLLNGLMDTDGCTDTKKVDFDNTNKKLANVVDYLIKSLGGKVSRSERIGKLYGVEKKMCYRVHTGGLVDVFSLPRKLEGQRKIPKRKHYYRFIKEIKNVGIRHVKCIQVDSPSHLYLAGTSFIPTHNTVMGARELEPVLMLPGKRLWIVGNTYDLAEKEFRVIWHDMLIKLGLGKEKLVRRSYAKKQGDLSIEFPWGTKLEVRSADRPENLVGEGLDYVIMSEAAKHSQETWDRFIRPALTDRRGSATFSSTPEGQNWLYQLWKMGQDPNEPDFASWRFPSWDNHYVYPLGKNDPEILLTKRTTPEEIFRQEYEADFTSFAGKIYSEFDESVHVKKVKYDPMLPSYVAFDWGFAAPMAAIEFQVDSMQRVRIWREQYETRMRLKDYLAKMKAREQPEGYRIDLCFGDAADPEAVVSVSEDFAPCYADPRSKIGTHEGTRESGWREGIELVKGFLKLQEISETDEYGAPEYEPWLIVDHSCVNTIREFNNHRIIDAVRGKDPREAGHSSDDHCLVAGTKVLTSRGNIPIENVKSGDFAATRSGFKEVTFSGLTKSDQVIYRLVTKGGRELYGTGNHPIMTINGWVTLDTLRYGDTLFACQSNGKIQTGQIGTVKREMFGENTSEKYRKDFMSTTKMAMPKTMSLKTCNVCHLKNIENCIQCRKKLTGNLLNILTEFSRLQKLGIEVMKDALGTSNMGNALGKIDLLIRENARNAELSSNLHLIVKEISTAPTNARALAGVLQALTTSKRYVPHVGNVSKQTNIVDLKLVLDSVVSVCEEKTKADVFDLTVTGDHEFFANSLLVSNSLDAIRYGLMHVFKLGATQTLASVMDDLEMRDIPDVGYFTSGMRFA